MRVPRGTEISLDNNVNFAADMRVCLYNKETSFLGDAIGNAPSKTLIGQFLVPVVSITKLYSYPQYFDVIDSNQNI
jgi:hypothetical protein